MQEAARLAAEAAMYELAAEAAMQEEAMESNYEDENHGHLDHGHESMAMDDEERQIALFNALKSAGGFHDSANLLQEMNLMGLDPNDSESMHQLLHALTEQEQERARPEEHYLTIAQNGSILEATKTVTGFPPDALLMTSAYDAVYEEDLPGLLAVKTHFWDRGVPDAEVFLRRRTIEGDWIWLKTKVVSYVNVPPNAMILFESCVEDESVAHHINRITRITSILVQAVEAAQVASLSPEDTNLASESQMQTEISQMQSLADDAAAYRKMLEHSANYDDGQIIKNALAETNANPVSRLEKEIMERIGGKKKETFDPFSVIEEVREGVRLDLGMTRLLHTEALMITLVLSGKLKAEDLVHIVYHALNAGENLEHLLNRFASADDLGTNGNASLAGSTIGQSPLSSIAASPIPPISVVNLSYTYLGNEGIDLFGRVLYMDDSPLRTIDLSFCGLEESGFIALSRALANRKQKRIAPLRGIILSGNHITHKAAAFLGKSLSPEKGETRSMSFSIGKPKPGGYDEDNESDEEDYAEGDAGTNGQNTLKLPENESEEEASKKYFSKVEGLMVLHLASALVSADNLGELLRGLGPDSPIRELSLASNHLCCPGASMLVDFLETKSPGRKKPVLPFLDRVDLSNNNLGNEGLAKLTAAIAKRNTIHLVELRLSNNGINASGIETMMKQLFQHNLVSLSVDKNSIGDQGCQLVAASLQSMKSLSRLNLGFNQIGSRGVNSLMRSLVACGSITYLGLSGNSIKISGAVALAFTLAQHPRLEELALENCCLSQAAQCHIVAGIISNRWVPMKKLSGFEVGPPMVALGALTVVAQNQNNKDCFQQIQDEQRKTIRQWMESNRAARVAGQDERGTADIGDAPSEDPYLRLLDWLKRIPFDEEELISLRKYFYDSDGGSEDRGSDGYINLKLRGDLLAALESDAADEIRDEFPMMVQYKGGSVGIDLEKIDKSAGRGSSWDYMRGDRFEKAQGPLLTDEGSSESIDDPVRRNGEMSSNCSFGSDQEMSAKKRRMYSTEFRDSNMQQHGVDTEPAENPNLSKGSMSTTSRESMRSLQHSGSEPSTTSQNERKRSTLLKPRITMFPKFELKLEEYKATANYYFEQEEDPDQQEFILTQYAEASLTILRQLRYHCMNSGLDGWRQGGMKQRKVLIVDDSKSSRKLFSRAFEKANFIVDTASNGAEGVEKLKQSIYDIAFMDIDMPVMNGFEATKKLREWEDARRPGARQPICALTASYVDDFERSELMKFKEAGLDVMESKPYNLPRLFKAVDDVSPMFSDLSISVIQQERGGNV